MLLKEGFSCLNLQILAFDGPVTELDEMVVLQKMIDSPAIVLQFRTREPKILVHSIRLLKADLSTSRKLI